MNPNYYIPILVILSVLTYCMFFQDTLKEYFEDSGQCMNLYSAARLNQSNVKLITSPENRGNAICPPHLCQIDDGKCVPNNTHKSNSVIAEYCSKDKFLEGISQQELCTRMGYNWKDGKCNPSFKRKQEECPTDTVCNWNARKDTCEAKPALNLYSHNDYDAVSDYCTHLKSLSEIVDKETCQSMGPRYQWLYNAQICKNIDVNDKNVNDECWKVESQDDCLKKNTDYRTCLWYPKVADIMSAADLAGLRETELKTMDSQMGRLESEVDKYISRAQPYQEKMDKEQAAKLIIDVMERDNKDRYKFEKGVRHFDQEYDAILQGAGL